MASWVCSSSSRLLTLVSLKFGYSRTMHWEICLLLQIYYACINVGVRTTGCKNWVEKTKILFCEATIILTLSQCELFSNSEETSSWSQRHCVYKAKNVFSHAFDLWPPWSDEYMLESNWMFVPNLKNYSNSIIDISMHRRITLKQNALGSGCSRRGSVLTSNKETNKWVYKIKTHCGQNMQEVAK